MPVLCRIISHGARNRSLQEWPFYWAVFIFQTYICFTVSNYSWGQLLSGSQMCSMSSNWCLFSSKKTVQGNSRLYCLPKGTVCHPETSAFYLKHWRRNGSIFQIYSLSIKHQRKENKIGYEGSFCSLIYTLRHFPAGKERWPPGMDSCVSFGFFYLYWFAHLQELTSVS